MSFYSRIWPAVLSFGAGLCSGYLILAWYRQRNERIRINKEVNQVLFFPDTQSPKESTTRTVSRNGNLSALLHELSSARESLDICIFTFSHHDLAEVLINAHQMGVVVRVLTDNEQIHSYACKVERLRSAGIQVRLDTTSYYMHHKFAIVDKHRLVNGSLNWTAQAVCGNQENVIVTTTKGLVRPFVEQFERLWEMYDPEKLVPSSTS